jgi:hypothetical protein
VAISNNKGSERSPDDQPTPSLSDRQLAKAVANVIHEVDILPPCFFPDVPSSRISSIILGFILPPTNCMFGMKLDDFGINTSFQSNACFGLQGFETNLSSGWLFHWKERLVLVER